MRTAALLGILAVFFSLAALPVHAATPSFTRPLWSGLQGDDVTLLQTYLINLGYLTGPTTGFYGDETVAAVEKFQQDHQLPVLGSVGPLTRAALAAVTPVSSSVSPSPETTSAPVATTATTLTHALIYGDQGADVLLLQQFLKDTGFYTYPTLTGYFGPSTLLAVSAYQKSQGIDPIGGVGPLTRARINAALTTAASSHASISPSLSGTMTATSTTPSSTTTPTFFSGGGGGSPTPPSTTTSTDTGSSTISIVTPTDGTIIHGTSVTLTASSTNSVGVQFTLDTTTNLGSEITTTSSPGIYTMTWDSTTVADGAHTISAVARDAAGNYTTTTVNVTLQNTSITQYGVTYQFDKAYPWGTFANGDPWVQGPVTLTNITPISTDDSGTPGTGRNGWEVNPSSHTYQPYDDRAKAFNAALQPSFPLLVNATSSIIKTISVVTIANNGNGTAVQTASILTVVGSTPPGNGSLVFRPPYFGSISTAKPYYYVNSVDLSGLPSLAPVSGALTLSQVASNFQVPRLDHQAGSNGSSIHPFDSGPFYGAAYADYAAEPILSLMSNNTPSDKKQAALNYIQQGIDLYQDLLTGENWAANGGIEVGRKMVLLFAGIALNNSDIENAVKNAPNNTFQEDGEKLYQQNANGGNGLTLWASGANVSQVGTPAQELAYWNEVEVPGSGSKIEGDPYGYIDGGYIPGIAYQLVNLGPDYAESIAIRLLPNGVKYWNDPNFFSYVQRIQNVGIWAQPDPCAPYDGTPANYGVTFGPDGNGSCIKGSGRFPSQHGLYKNNPAAGFYADTFADNMYAAYSSTVDVTPPIIMSVASDTPTSSSVNITWSTDEPATSQVSYGLTSSYTNSTTLDSTATTSHSVNLAGLTANTLYHYHVFSGDQSGNATSSIDYTFTTASGVVNDTTPPTVSLITPTDSTVVSGTSLALTATASDNTSVAGVQFYYDTEHPIGSEITASPYTAILDTTTLADGSHTILAVARDTSGNYATSSAITAIADNCQRGTGTDPNNNGCTGQDLTSAIIHPDFFTSYGPQSGQTYVAATSVAGSTNAHPPQFNVAGVDYPVGAPSTTTMTTIASVIAANALPAGCVANNATYPNTIYCTGNNSPTFDHIDFTNGGTACVPIVAAYLNGTMTITHSYWKNGMYCGGHSTLGDGIPYDQSRGTKNVYAFVMFPSTSQHPDLVFKYNTIDGDFVTNYYQFQGVYFYSSGNADVEYNSFSNMPGADVKFAGDTGSHWVFKYNYTDQFSLYAFTGHGEIETGAAMNQGAKGTSCPDGVSAPCNDYPSVGSSEIAEWTISGNTTKEGPLSCGFCLTTTLYAAISAGFGSFDDVNVNYNVVATNPTATTAGLMSFYGYIDDASGNGHYNTLHVCSDATCTAPGTLSLPLRNSNASYASGAPFDIYPGLEVPGQPGEYYLVCPNPGTSPCGLTTSYLPTIGVGAGSAASPIHFTNPVQAIYNSAAVQLAAIYIQKSLTMQYNYFDNTMASQATPTAYFIDFLHPLANRYSGAFCMDSTGAVSTISDNRSLLSGGIIGPNPNNSGINGNGTGQSACVWDGIH